ncbi:unnamed protein product, partial [Discosporangium mesarthrocarpum]
ATVAANPQVLWHCFGLVHVPRPEDFPVSECRLGAFW